MTITEVLTVEHALLGSIFDDIQRELPAMTLPEVHRLSALVESVLGRHGTQEQDLAYAALDHALAEKGKLDRLYQDHQEIDGGLSAVRSASNPADARQLLHAAIVKTRAHFQHEEQVIFPLLDRLLPGKLLKDLGQAWVCRNRPGLN